MGSSPEILVRLEAGSDGPPGGDAQASDSVTEDETLEADLLSDKKEIAEHLMLIDLGRNDVGRVAGTWLGHSDRKMVVERYSHVVHIVSNVMGRAREPVRSMRSRQHCLPVPKWCAKTQSDGDH